MDDFLFRQTRAGNSEVQNDSTPSAPQLRLPKTLKPVCYCAACHPWRAPQNKWETSVRAGRSFSPWNCRRVTPGSSFPAGVLASHALFLQCSRQGCLDALLPVPLPSPANWAHHCSSSQPPVCSILGVPQCHGRDAGSLKQNFFPSVITGCEAPVFTVVRGWLPLRPSAKSQIWEASPSRSQTQFAFRPRDHTAAHRCAPQR